MAINKQKCEIGDDKNVAQIIVQFLQRQNIVMPNNRSARAAMGGLNCEYPVKYNGHTRKERSAGGTRSTHANK